MQCWQNGGAGTGAALGTAERLLQWRQLDFCNCRSKLQDLAKLLGAGRCTEHHLACPDLYR